MNVDHDYNLREELGPIPEGWVAVHFASVREWLQYGTSVRCRSEPTEFPVLRIPNVELGQVNTSDLKFGELSSSEASRYRLHEGDLIFIRTNGVIERLGSCAVYENQPENALFASYLIRARLKLEQVDPHFAAYFFASERGNRIIAGRATPAADGKFNLNTGTIDSLPFPLPPTLDEQCEIVRALASVRDAIKLHDQSLTVSQSLKSATMRALFTKGMRGEAQKDTEIGPVPESWNVVEFAEVRERLQYGTSTHCTYETSAFPVLRIPNIEPGRVNTSDIKFASLQEDEAKRYLLKNGDLIFIRTNGVIERLGACAVFAGQPEGALFASYLIRAQLKQERVDPYFAAHFFGSELGTSIVAGRATPAADGKYNLNTGTIDGLPLPLPPTLEEQNEIVAILDAIDRKMDLHKRKRAVLNKLFKALLHKLMTGEIRVADLDLSALEPVKETEAAA